MRPILLTERHEKRRADRTFPQERFLEKAANVANIILAGGGVVSLLALLYFFYHYGWTGERKFDSSMGVVLYYLVPAGVAGLLFASLKLKAGYKINLKDSGETALRA